MLLTRSLILFKKVCCEVFKHLPWRQTNIENCIIESLDSIRANSRYVEEDETEVITEKRYGLRQPCQKGA